MNVGEVHIKTGPVFVDGELVFTATRDLLVRAKIEPGNIIRPDGTTPKWGDAMTAKENAVMLGTVEFTQ